MGAVEQATPVATNVDEYERLAREALDAAGWSWLSGGAGNGRTVAANTAAFERQRLCPRVLVDVSSVSTATQLLGAELSIPVAIAPVAHQRLLHPEGELATARAAAEAGTVACLPMLSNTPLGRIAAAVPAGVRWQQLYCLRDTGAMEALIQEALECGIEALVLTVDAPRRSRRPHERPTLEDQLDASMSWRRLERLVATSPLPVVLKGILDPADAVLACEHGAAGIVVSNHGGRQLDGCVATMDALPAIAEAVAGRVPLLLDGGVRRGIDVVSALAAGADAVMVGRPAMWGLAADGERGVRAVLELLRLELEEALALLGLPDVDRCRQEDRRR